MSPLDIFWHLLNLFLPALGMALLAPGLAKLVYRRELADASFSSLFARCLLVSAVCLLVGLVYFGRDGRMATYVALVLVNAAVLWWTMRRSRSGGF